MCALITAPTWGELSGKLGGNIFARNGHGSYVRKYTKPINPNTLAQQNARATFTSASNLYSTLDSFDKSQWNEYAKNQYKPRKISRTGKNNGYDAFMSLNQVKRMMYNDIRATDFLFDGVGWPTELNFCVPNLSTIIPPEKNKLIVYKDQFNKPINVVLNEVEFSQSGALKIKIGYHTDGTDVYIDENVDMNDNLNGYIVYCSEAKYSSGSFYATPFAKVLKYVRPWTPFSPPSSAVKCNELTIEVGSDFNRSRFKEYPLVGEFVLITVYSVDCQGQMENLGSKEVQVLSFIP